MDTYLEKLKKEVRLGRNVFIAPNATVLGNVSIGKKSSVWFNAVIRADIDRITIGENCNIQDGTIIHPDKNCPVIIGNNITIGHSAIIHGARIDDNTLVGMRATIMNNVKIGKCCIIGANTLVTERTVIPDYSLVFGSPGKIIKRLTPDYIKRINIISLDYVRFAKKYLIGR